MNKKIILFLVLFFVIVFVFVPSANATVFFHYDAESGTVGEDLPHHHGTGPNFCQTECSGLGDRGTIQNEGGAPQGNKYFQWATVASQINHYTELQNHSTLPVAPVIGAKYYLAYYMRFDRINGLDIWHEGAAAQSSDKGVEMNGSVHDGLRVILARGQWDKCDGSYSPGFAANADHKFTIWASNWGTSLPQPSYATGSGYSCTHPPQLDYEKWYSVVMAVKMACDATGSVEVWLNGVIIIEQLNVQTMTSCSINIDHITMGGTIAQPGYDAPPHYRKFDDLMLTDNWQDIVNEGYLADPNSSTPPTCTSFTYSSWTPSTCPSNGTQTRTITSSSPTGCTGGTPVLSQSCTSVTMYNLTNFLQLTADWLKIVSSSPADVNHDGKVDSRDLGIMMSNWN